VHQAAQARKPGVKEYGNAQSPRAPDQVAQLTEQNSADGRAEHERAGEARKP